MSLDSLQNSSGSLSNSRNENGITKPSMSSTMKSITPSTDTEPREASLATIIKSQSDLDANASDAPSLVEEEACQKEQALRTEGGSMEISKTDKKDKITNQETPAIVANDEDYGYVSSESSIHAISALMGLANAPRKKKKRLQQHAHHLIVTENRIGSLEQRLDVLEKVPPEPPIPAKVKCPAKVEDCPAKPQLNFVEWAQFKATRGLKNTDERYAIDVLIGEPVLYHQRLRQTANSNGTGSSYSQLEADNLPLETVPERIRINSQVLIAILKNVIGGSLRTPSGPLVVLRPYKAFMYYENELRETLESMQSTFTSHSNPTTGNSSQEDAVFDIPLVTGLYNTNIGGRGSNEKALANDIETQKDLQKIEEMHCLIRFLDALKRAVNAIRETPGKPSKIGDIAIDLADGFAKKEERLSISFKDLWYFFHPGGYVVLKAGLQRVWRVVHCTGGRAFLSAKDQSRSYDRLEGSLTPHMHRYSPFVLDCYHIDFDGKRFGPVYHRFEIQPFDNTQEISSLDLFPIEYAPFSDAILQEVSKQGKVFVNVTNACHKYCLGRTLTSTPPGIKLDISSHPEDVDGPVMIDFDRALQINPSWGPDFTIAKLAESDTRETREMTPDEDITCGGRSGCYQPCCCQNENILDDGYWDRRRMNDFVSREHILRVLPDCNNFVAPSPTDYRLCPNRVFGFVLRSRKWACLPVSSLKEIKRETSNLLDLELPGHHKDIVIGLVETHFRNKSKEKRAQKPEPQGEFDLVRAKGKGLIILLHGAPGVGKTSTAECIAEANATPLFPITCGDLGLNPVDVERNLDLNFQLAESWGCVLLLDEADVFLAQRTQHDIERNALVSIFLRALEYYSGILFLTTNRVGTIDEAFRSRIHMSLLYPILSESQTIKIWEGQLARAKKRDPTLLVKTEDVLSYARNLYKQQMEKRGVGWNGRQIRNAMQTAVALAEYNSVMSTPNVETPQSPSLEIRWFNIIAGASWQFEAYLEDTLQLTAREYARHVSLRADRASGDHLVMPQVSAGVPPVQPLYDSRPIDASLSTQPQRSSLFDGGAENNHPQTSTTSFKTSAAAVPQVHYAPTSAPHYPSQEASSSIFGPNRDVPLSMVQQVAMTSPYGNGNMPNIPSQSSLAFPGQQRAVPPIAQQYHYYGGMDQMSNHPMAYTWRDPISSGVPVGNITVSGQPQPHTESQCPQPPMSGPGNSSH